MKEDPDGFISDEPMTEDQASPELFISDEPMTGHAHPKSLPTPHEKAQQGLGRIIVATAMIAYLLAVVFFLFDLTDTTDHLGEIITYVFSGLQTLTAAVVGFYFGSRQKN